jgi:ketosteroid isomerase-like protein
MRSLVERINAGDVEGQLEFIHPDVVRHAPEDEPEGGTYRGLDGYREYSADWTDTFEAYHAEIEEYIDAGECVIVIGRIEATGPNSGVRVESPGIWVWRLRDGLGIECREYRTRAEALEAVRLAE